jgi:hypothetical protein
MLTWMVLPRVLMEHKRKKEREDIIKKCKSSLVIAQRARQAKDEAGEETVRLREPLKTLQIQTEQVHNGEIYSDTGRSYRFQMCVGNL